MPVITKTFSMYTTKLPVNIGADQGEFLYVPTFLINEIRKQNPKMVIQNVTPPTFSFNGELILPSGNAQPWAKQKYARYEYQVVETRPVNTMFREALYSFMFYGINGGYDHYRTNNWFMYAPTNPSSLIPSLEMRCEVTGWVSIPISVKNQGIIKESKNLFVKNQGIMKEAKKLFVKNQGIIKEVK